jgi:hypothetical protein
MPRALKCQLLLFALERENESTLDGASAATNFQHLFHLFRQTPLFPQTPLPKSRFALRYEFLSVQTEYSL